MALRNLFAIAVILLLTTSVHAERILFYEISSGQYSIEKDYSEFANELRKRGFEVASIEKGEISKEKLENYDILIVQDLGKQLSTDEISAIIWFVLQNGRGLFINGGGKEKANQLTIPFGATVDSGLLIDTSDEIPALNDRNSFTISQFTNDPSMNLLHNGVSKVGFYKDSGIILSGNSKCIAKGNSDTYSDTGSFASGSEPCIAAASLFGGGLVMTLSDADMLSNKYINDFNNKNFGLNIIEWLNLANQEIDLGNNTQTLHLRIKEMRLETLKIRQELNKSLDREKAALSQLSSANLQVSNLQAEVTELKESRIGPFSQSSWAFIILGVCILVGAIAYSRRGSVGEVKLKDDDILNELGYELDEGGESDEVSDEELDL